MTTPLLIWATFHALWHRDTDGGYREVSPVDQLDIWHSVDASAATIRQDLYQIAHCATGQRHRGGGLPYAGFRCQDGATILEVVSGHPARVVASATEDETVVIIRQLMAADGPPVYPGTVCDQTATPAVEPARPRQRENTTSPAASGRNPTIPPASSGQFSLF